MEYKHISKIVHLHICNLNDILIDNKHKSCLYKWEQSNRSSLNKGGVWPTRILVKLVVSWWAWIMTGDKNNP